MRFSALLASFVVALTLEDVLKALRANPDRRDPKAKKALRARKGCRVKEALQARGAPKARRVSRERKGIRGETR